MVLTAGTSPGAGFLQNFDRDGMGEPNAWKYMVILCLVSSIEIPVKVVLTPTLAPEAAIGYYSGSSPSFLRGVFWSKIG